jgi:Ca-activated chloride channel family protein
MGIITRIDPLEVRQPATLTAGLGTLDTERGTLPLHRLDVRAVITGLSSATRLTQAFRNTFDVPLEATYIFPLPDRAAVTALTMTVAGRVVHAELQERAAAREAYDVAIAEGRRASIAEEERPDVFTLRVGNILPGEEAVVELTLAGPLPMVDGQAEFRFPLVVAPRYIPGRPLPGQSVGTGWSPDTDAVPDASRITPPTLLPRFPNPVALSIEARIDPAGLDLAAVASSLHAIAEGEDGVLRVHPGERLNRDFILRLDYTNASDSLVLVPDAESEDEGTYQLIVMPPEPPASAAPRPKDVILVLDRSGSMGGWKMVAARRAAARIVDTLTDADRFSVLLFDHTLEIPHPLVPASDRNRFRAIEHLAKTEARGGTEMLDPLYQAAVWLTLGPETPRDRVIVLITDGQVGNEDQILAKITGRLSGERARVRVHCVGIDQAVNAGFLGRLAAIGGGRCELVESEDRLDAAMDRIHRRIGSPTVTDLRIEDAEGLTTLPDSATPSRVTALFPGVPLVRTGRYKGTATGALTISGLTVDEEPWTRTVHAVVAEDRSEVAAIWARARVRDLEDRYAVDGTDALEQEIVQTSLKHGVLCRFTAYVAIDTVIAADGSTTTHKVTQLVEEPAGTPHPHPVAFAAPAMSAAPPPAPSAMPRPGGGVRPAARLGGTPVTMKEPTPEDGVIREQAALEASRLRESADEPASRRRELLEDLASRLDALWTHVGPNTSGPIATHLQLLIKFLRNEDEPLDVRWARALKDLMYLEKAAAHGHPFWKHP